MSDHSIVSIVAQFAFATVLPVLVSILLSLPPVRTRLGRLGYWPRQMLFGLVFGIIAVFGTEFGIETHQATMNVRDAAPIVAGLYFGGPAGIIAGIIGGVERWFSVLWGRGMFTRVACSLATILVGCYAAILSKYVFGRRKPRWPLALSTGIVAEVLHLLLVFVTNMDDTLHAFLVVRACSLPMIGCTGLAVALAGIAITFATNKSALRKPKVPDISQNIQVGMLGVVAIAFIVSVGFTFSLQEGMTKAETTDVLELDLRDIAHEVSDEENEAQDMEKRVAAAVANRHTGTDGFAVALDKDGNLVGTRSDIVVSGAEALSLYERALGFENGVVFDVTLGDTEYYAAKRVVDDYLFVALLPVEEANTSRDLSVLVTSFLEVIIFAALFVSIYLLIARVVVHSIWQVNGRLHQITSGDLSVEVDVRDSYEFASLSDDINRTVASLRDAIAAEAARIERDLLTARAIQTSALPQTFPPFPHVDAFDIYASMRAAREVGGDFYDFFLMDEHRLGFVIADVSDKGIPAALFMMSAKAQLSNYMQAGMSLSDAVQTANWQLCQGNDTEMFVTAWAGELDYENGELTYVNAGHNPPLLRHHGTWQWLTKKCGPFLGGFDIATYRQETILLEPGDELLLYTDGVSEAFSPQNEEYGNDRLEAFLSANSSLHPRPLIDALFGELRTWAAGTAQSDDITMLALEYGIPPAMTGKTHVPATIDGMHAGLSFINGELTSRLCPLKTQRQIDYVFSKLFGDALATIEEPDKNDVCVEYVYNALPNALTVSLTYRGDGSDSATKCASQIADQIDDISCVRDGELSTVAFRKAW